MADRKTANLGASSVFKIAARVWSACAVSALAIGVIVSPASAEPDPLVVPAPVEETQYARGGAVFFDESIQPSENQARQGPSGDECVAIEDESGPLVLCQRLIDPPDSRTAARVQEQARSAADDMLPFPIECALQVGDSNTYRGTRTSACLSRYSEFQILREVDGVMQLTGTVESILYSWIFTSRTGLVWAHQFSLVPWAAWGEGVGYTIKAVPQDYCGTDCTVENFTAVSEPAVIGVPATGIAYFESDMPAAGSPLDSHGDWTWWFEKGPGNSSSRAATVVPYMRCDDDIPGRSAGCVMARFPGSIEYSSAALPEFVAHITQAQASGLPGGTQETALNRIPTGDPLIAQNRQTACPSASWLPRPTGKSCDEYPFASSWQGAMTGGGTAGGTARTFSWCQVTLQGPPSVGSTGYSICMIDKTENITAGSQLGAHLSTQRVGPWERYTVGSF